MYNDSFCPICSMCDCCHHDSKQQQQHSHTQKYQSHQHPHSQHHFPPNNSHDPLPSNEYDCPLSKHTTLSSLRTATKSFNVALYPRFIKMALLVSLPVQISMLPHLMCLIMPLPLVCCIAIPSTTWQSWSLTWWPNQQRSWCFPWNLSWKVNEADGREVIVAIDIHDIDKGEDKNDSKNDNKNDNKMTTKMSMRGCCCLLSCCHCGQLWYG